MIEQLLWDAISIAEAYRERTGTPGGGNRLVCPVHGSEDSDANATIFETETTGAIWAQCHSQGCDPQEILASVYMALGVERGTTLPDVDTAKDRWSPNTQVDDWPNFDTSSVVEWLPRRAGIAGVKEIRYPVVDGECTRPNCRQAHKGNKCITSRGRAQNALVNMWCQTLPAKGEVVYWCEGPKDAVTIAKMGFPAIAGPGGAKQAGRPDYSVVSDWKIVVCTDNDQAGVLAGISAEAKMVEDGVEVVGFTRPVGGKGESPADLDVGEMVDVLTSWLAKAEWLDAMSMPTVLEGTGFQTVLGALDGAGWLFRFDPMMDEQWVDWGQGWRAVNRTAIAEVNARLAQKFQVRKGETAVPLELDIGQTRQLLELGCLREGSRCIMAWEEFLQPIIEGERQKTLRLSNVVEQVFSIRLTPLEIAGLDLVLPHLVWRVWRLWEMASAGEPIAGGANWQQRIVPVLYEKRGGVGKSTLITSLLEDAGVWAETIGSGDLDGKNFVEKTKKALIINFDDIEDLRGKDFAKVRRFITEEKSTVRLSYRMDADTYPRVGVWIASTNKSRVLDDEENTRFLYVDLDKAREGVNGGDVREYLGGVGVRESLIQTAWEDCQTEGWEPYLNMEMIEELRKNSERHTYVGDEAEVDEIQGLMAEICAADEAGETSLISERLGAEISIYKPGVRMYGKHMLQKDLRPDVPYVLMKDFHAALYGSVMRGAAGRKLLDIFDKLDYRYTPYNKVHVEEGGKMAWRRYRCLFLY